MSRTGRTRPPLDLLAAVLPGPDQTDFLVACLAPPSQALAAWRRWRVDHVPAEWLSGPNRGLRGLGALLATSLLAAGAPLDARDAAWLRAALVHEEHRSRAYRTILGEVLAALVSEGVPFLLGKGAAVAETVFRQPWLRHSHDIDLLVAPDRLHAAAAALGRAGLSERPRGDAGRSLLHPSGLPVELHTRPIGLPLPGPAVEDFAARADRAQVLGVTVSVPAGDDLLLYVCGHAVTNASRRTARWVCDAHEIVVRRPQLDWSRLRATAAAAGLAAPLATTLGYLADAIGTPVPAAARAGLADDAARATRLERELLVHAARATGAVSFRSLWAATGAASRVTLLSWALAPDPRYLRWLDGGSRRFAPAIQGRRLLRRLARACAVVGTR